MKTFTDNISANFPELKETGRELVKALDNSVVYNKRGSVLSRGGGLSKDFPTDFYGVIQSSTQGKSVDLSRLADMIVEVDEEKKTATIELSEEDLEKVASVRHKHILHTE